VATVLPTSRSIRTVAPSTGPAGPLTVPTRLASPGPRETVVEVVVRGTVDTVVVGRLVVEVVAATVVVVSSTTVVAGAAAGPPPPLQAAATRAIAATTRSDRRTAQDTRGSDWTRADAEPPSQLTTTSAGGSTARRT
jgi:hypothetical protein